MYVCMHVCMYVCMYPYSLKPHFAAFVRSAGGRLIELDGTKRGPESESASVPHNAWLNRSPLKALIEDHIYIYHILYIYIYVYICIQIV